MSRTFLRPRTEGGVAKTVHEAWSAIREDRPLWLAIAGTVYFWGIASLLGQDIMVYTESVVKGMPNASTLTGLPMAVFGVGVGAGSMLAARLSASKIETGMIPLGCIGLSAFTFILGVTGPGFTGTLILMGLLGVSSGLITVPLHALVQWRSLGGPAGRGDRGLECFCLRGDHGGLAGRDGDGLSRHVRAEHRRCGVRGDAVLHHLGSADLAGSAPCGSSCCCLQPRFTGFASSAVKKYRKKAARC